jgi:ParB-like nuclease domain/DNA methylase
MANQSISAARLQIRMCAPDALKPATRNPRTHSKMQVRQIADSITRFGFTNPILVDSDDRILAGHGRVAAAKLIGMAEVPVLCMADLSADERKAYALADNKLALNAGWDRELLALELQELIDLDFEVELTGFSLAEIDFTLDAANAPPDGMADNRADHIPAVASRAVSRPGDLWQLGRHRLLCGDARAPADFAALMADERADIIFTDPPYNVPIDGHVCGLGRIRHREFAMGAGEMSVSEFTHFLSVSLTSMANHARSGAILFVCMDWRHMRELSDAGDASGLVLKNLVVWNKTNSGMGAFYRSKHELIFVFKHGDAPHVNSFGLGDTGPMFGITPGSAACRLRAMPNWRCTRPSSP